MALLKLTLFVTVLFCPWHIYAVKPGHEDRTEPGELLSRGYPRPYPKGVKDSWLFERPYGVWAVVFDDMDIEKTEDCRDDYLLVRDPIRSVDLVRACGDKTPEPVYSSGPKLLISFNSDNLNQGSGFRLRVLHDVTREALRSRLVQPTTTVKQQRAEPKVFSQDDLMVLVLSLALLVAVIVVICLASWIVYHQFFRRGHTCCVCSRSSASKDVVVNMEPSITVRKAKSYTKQPRPKEPPVDPTGNGSPNVYLPMPDSDTTDQSTGSSLQRKGTDATSPDQLPLYHTPQPSFMEEAKFIGVM